MAQDLFETLGHDLESFAMYPGRRSSFEIKANGKLVFSKLADARFPESVELIKLIQSMNQSE